LQCEDQPRLLDEYIEFSVYNLPIKIKLLIADVNQGYHYI